MAIFTNLKQAFSQNRYEELVTPRSRETIIPEHRTPDTEKVEDEYKQFFYRKLEARLPTINIANPYQGFSQDKLINEFHTRAEIYNTKISKALALLSKRTAEHSQYAGNTDGKLSGGQIEARNNQLQFLKEQVVELIQDRSKHLDSTQEKQTINIILDDFIKNKNNSLNVQQLMKVLGDADKSFVKSLQHNGLIVGNSLVDATKNLAAVPELVTVTRKIEKDIKYADRKAAGEEIYTINENPLENKVWGWVGFAGRMLGTIGASIAGMTLATSASAGVATVMATLLGVATAPAWLVGAGVVILGGLLAAGIFLGGATIFNVLNTRREIAAGKISPNRAWEKFYDQMRNDTIEAGLVGVTSFLAPVGRGIAMVLGKIPGVSRVVAGARSGGSNIVFGIEKVVEGAKFVTDKILYWPFKVAYNALHLVAFKFRYSGLGKAIGEGKNFVMYCSTRASETTSSKFLSFFRTIFEGSVNQIVDIAGIFLSPVKRLVVGEALWQVPGKPLQVTYSSFYLRNNVVTFVKAVPEIFKNFLFKAPAQESGRSAVSQFFKNRIDNIIDTSLPTSFSISGYGYHFDKQAQRETIIKFNREYGEKLARSIAADIKKEHPDWDINSAQYRESFKEYFTRFLDIRLSLEGLSDAQITLRARNNALIGLAISPIGMLNTTSVGGKGLSGLAYNVSANTYKMTTKLQAETTALLLGDAVSQINLENQHSNDVKKLYDQHIISEKEYKDLIANYEQKELNFWEIFTTSAVGNLVGMGAARLGRARRFDRNGKEVNEFIESVVADTWNRDTIRAPLLRQNKKKSNRLEVELEVAKKENERLAAQLQKKQLQKKHALFVQEQERQILREIKAPQEITMKDIDGLIFSEDRKLIARLCHNNDPKTGKLNTNDLSGAKELIELGGISGNAKKLMLRQLDEISRLAKQQADTDPCIKQAAEDGITNLKALDKRRAVDGYQRRAKELKNLQEELCNSWKNNYNIGKLKGNHGVAKSTIVQDESGKLMEEFLRVQIKYLDQQGGYKIAQNNPLTTIDNPLIHDNSLVEYIKNRKEYKKATSDLKKFAKGLDDDFDKLFAEQERERLKNRTQKEKDADTAFKEEGEKLGILEYEIGGYNAKFKEALENVPQLNFIAKEFKRLARYGGDVTVLDPWITRIHNLKETGNKLTAVLEFLKTSGLTDQNTKFEIRKIERDIQTNKAQYEFNLKIFGEYIKRKGITLPPPNP